MTGEQCRGARQVGRSVRLFRFESSVAPGWAGWSDRGKIRPAPFFTFTKVRLLAESTFDVEVITQRANDLLLAIDDQRRVRLLGARREMVPPEGGH